MRRSRSISTSCIRISVFKKRAEEETMRQGIALLAGVAAVALSAGTALAQVSDDVVKLAVLNDQSGTYADIAGQGAVVAGQKIGRASWRERGGEYGEVWGGAV